MDTTSNLLMDMGITPNLKGFDYIKTAVILICQDHDKYRGITTVLYPELAETHSTTCAKVERNIRHAVQRAIKLDTGEMKVLIGLSPYKNQVSNAEFLFSLARTVNGNGI